MWHIENNFLPKSLFFPNGLVRHFLGFFLISPRTIEKVREVFILAVYTYLSNNNKTTGMDVDLELEMTMYRREL